MVAGFAGGVCTDPRCTKKERKIKEKECPGSKSTWSLLRYCDRSCLPHGSDIVGYLGIEGKLLIFLIPIKKKTLPSRVVLIIL